MMNRVVYGVGFVVVSALIYAGLRSVVSNAGDALVNGLVGAFGMNPKKDGQR